MSTAHHTLGGVAVPRGMIWIDEHDWVPVEKSLEYSVTGALLIDAAVMQAGRPITLQGEESAGWIKRSTLQALQALASVPGTPYTLLLADGRSFEVEFAPGKCIEAQPIGRPELPTSNNPYAATLRLIEV